MDALLKRKSFLCFMIYLCVLTTMTSPWVSDVLCTPLFVNRVLTVLIYIPFILVIFLKLIEDINEYQRTLRKPIECLYYSLALYYMLITVYRFVNGMEVKENLYYSIVFFGSIAFYLMSSSKIVKATRSDMTVNLVMIDLLFVLYRLIYCVVGAHFFEDPPINVNLTSGAVAMLTPFIGNLLINKCYTRRDKIIYGLILCSNVVVLFTTGSRTIFYLLIVILGTILACNIDNRKGFTRVVCSILAGCVIVLTLAVINVGDVRYSIYRQTGMGKEIQGIINTENADQAQQAAEQILRSDNMREQLVRNGLEQIQLNPWIGTGDVEYYFQVTKEYGVLQSSHNFLIEAIICYGCVGLVIIAGMFMMIIKDNGLFSKGTQTVRKQKIVIVLTILFYFGFGFVQPTVFNHIICPLFVAIIAACKDAMLEENTTMNQLWE